MEVKVGRLTLRDADKSAPYDQKLISVLTPETFPCTDPEIQSDNEVLHNPGLTSPY